MAEGEEKDWRKQALESQKSEGMTWTDWLEAAVLVAMAIALVAKCAQ
ncbi:hypothetical protein [Streptomyces sp. NPDC000851]